MLLVAQILAQASSLDKLIEQWPYGAALIMVAAALLYYQNKRDTSQNLRDLKRDARLEQREKDREKREADREQRDEKRYDQILGIVLQSQTHHAAAMKEAAQACHVAQHEIAEAHAESIKSISEVITAFKDELAKNTAELRRLR